MVGEVVLDVERRNKHSSELKEAVGRGKIQILRERERESDKERERESSNSGSHQLQ